MAISPLTRFFHVSILRKNVDLSKMTLRGGVLLPNTLVDLNLILGIANSEKTCPSNVGVR